MGMGIAGGVGGHVSGHGGYFVVIFLVSFILSAWCEDMSVVTEGMWMCSCACAFRRACVVFGFWDVLLWWLG